MTINTAILATLYHGATGATGPHPLNSYPDDYAVQGLSGAQDALGFTVGECGSYAMCKVQQMTQRTLISAKTGLPFNWPSAVPPSWLFPGAAPGDVAIRPSSGAGDNGHAMIVEAVLPPGFLLPGGAIAPEGSFIASSYNSYQDGAYALEYWAPSGSFNGIPFTLSFITFPPGDS